MDTVIVFSTFNLAEGQLMRSRLESAGFQATLADENSAANFDVTSGGVHLIVPEDQAVDARELIESELKARNEQ
jgi:hypothetical protein